MSFAPPAWTGEIPASPQFTESGMLMSTPGNTWYQIGVKLTASPQLSRVGLSMPV
ncbi:hypothetical protein D3C71_1429120 [compost metagenome]